MLTEKMEQALNDQINAELFSSYLYYSMAAYFKDVSLDGFANWMIIQAQEEMVHAQKFFDYINERRDRVVLEAIAKPDKEWDSALIAFEQAFKHEQYITGRINDLVALSLEEKDNATYNFLQWFVSEQVEEEASVDEVVQKLKLVDGFGAGIFMIDQELGGRIVSPPAQK